MTLIGNTYVVPADPGAVGYGYQWANSTTGDLWARNTSNSAWVAIGNSNLTNLGLAPKSGFAATGGITGVSGWAPADSPDFTTAAKLEGISLATVNDITEVTDNIYQTIETLVAQAMSAYVVHTTVTSNVAIGSGLFSTSLNTAQTIPLPIFTSDGKMATQAQCKWCAWPTTIYGHDFTGGNEGDTRILFCDESGAEIDPTSTLTMNCKTTFRDLTWYNKWAYLIIGVR